MAFKFLGENVSTPVLGMEVTLVREWLRSHKAIGIFLFFIITIRLFFT